MEAQMEAGLIIMVNDEEKGGCNRDMGQQDTSHNWTH